MSTKTMKIINDHTLIYRHGDVVANNHKKRLSRLKQVAAGLPAKLIAQPDWQWPRVPGRVHAGDLHRRRRQHHRHHHQQ